MLSGVMPNVRARQAAERIVGRPRSPESPARTSSSPDPQSGGVVPVIVYALVFHSSEPQLPGCLLCSDEVTEQDLCLYQSALKTEYRG
jgi:hypothetical protein